VGASFARFDVSVGIPAPTWVFVPERAILAPRIREEIVVPPRNVTIIRNTQHVTNITVVDNRVMNHGIPLQRVEQVTGRPVPRRRVREIGSAEELAGRSVEEDTVPVFRPKVAKAKARARGQAEKVSRDGADPDASTPENEEGKQDPEAGEARPAETMERGHPGEKASPPSGVGSEKVRKREAKELRKEQEKAEHERKAEERRETREERKREQEQEKAEREREAEERREAREERKRERDEPAPPASKPAASEGDRGESREEKKGDLEAGQSQSAEMNEERPSLEKASPPSGVDSEKLRKREAKELRKEQEKAEHERKVEERREAREERKRKGDEPAPPASKPAAPEGDLRESREEKKGDLEAGKAQSAETPGEPHGRGEAMPPPGVAPEKLRTRQEEDLRTEREKKLPESREAREKPKGKGTASAPSERGGEKESPASKPARKKKD
jgi:hypothetical protein